MALLGKGRTRTHMPSILQIKTVVKAKDGKESTVVVTQRKDDGKKGKSGKKEKKKDKKKHDKNMRRHEKAMKRLKSFKPPVILDKARRTVQTRGMDPSEKGINEMALAEIEA